MANFLSKIGNKLRWVTGLSQSTGVADAGKLVQTDESGLIDSSLIPQPNDRLSFRFYDESSTLVISIFDNTLGLTIENIEQVSPGRYLVTFSQSILAGNVTIFSSTGNRNADIDNDGYRPVLIFAHKVSDTVLTIITYDIVANEVTADLIASSWPGFIHITKY